MKILLQFLFISFISISLFAKDTLKFAPLPMKDSKTIYNEFYPMIEYLKNRLHVDIEFVYYESYEEIVQNFQAGKVDLAYLGPLPYVELKKNFPDAEPVVYFKNRIGQTSYTCSLVASITNSMRKRVALTQPLSTCGYLSVNAMLDKKLENYDYKYLGRHDLVAQSVLEGEFDMGGVKSDIATEYYHLGLDEIAKTKPFPMFALVINTKKVSKNFVYDLSSALIYVDQSELNKWGKPIKYGVKKAQDSDYDGIREMQKDITISKESNIK